MATPTAFVRFPQSPDDNDLEIPDDSAFDLASDFTIVARLKWSGSPEASTRTIVGKGVTATGLCWRFGRHSSGRPILDWFWNNGGTRTQMSYQTATQTLPSSDWNWVAVTWRRSVTGSSVCRFWTSTDNVDDPASVSWTQLGTDQTGADASSRSVWQGDAVRIGGTEFSTHGNPLNAELAYLSLRNGTGTSGVVGGTEFFRFNANTDISLSNATQFTANSGQTVYVYRNGSPGIELVPPAPTASESIVVTGSALVVPDASTTVGFVATADGRVPWGGPVPATDRGMPLCKVEAAIGQAYDVPVASLTWTRIDDDCCVMSLATKEGRNTRIDLVEPGEYEIVFDNTNAKLDPANDQSPWWSSGRPGIDYGTRIRVTLYEDAADVTGRVLFVAMATRLFPRWEAGFATMRIAMVDSLSVLATEPMPVSAMRQELLAEPVVGSVWPLSSIGTDIEDVKGTLDGSWSDPVTTGSSLLPYDDSPSTLTADNVVGTISGINLDALSGSGRWGIGLWVRGDKDTIAFGDTVFRLAGAGGHHITVKIKPSGGAPDTLQITVTGGSPVNVSDVVGDGELHFLRIIFNGGYQFQVDDGSLTSISASPTYLTLDTLEIGAAAAVAPGRVAYAMFANLVYGTSGDDYRLDFAYAAATAAWSGETTAERFQRICVIAGTESAVVGTGFPDAAPAGAIAGENGLEHVTQCANGDGATVTVDHAAGGIPLYRKTDPDAPIVWFDTLAAVGAPVRKLDPVYGVDRLVKRVELRKGSGEVITAASTQNYPTAPVAKVETKLALTSDARARAAAILAEREVPRQLTPTMQLVARDIRVPWAALFMRPGDQAGVIAHPPGRSEFVQVSSVERVEHEIDWQDRTWTVFYGLDRVAQWLTVQDVIDLYSTVAVLIATFDTIADLLASGAPNPPTP